MKRVRISHNIYNWGSFLKGIGIVALAGGLLLATVELTAGLIVASCGPLLYIIGVFFNGVAVMSEAANKYLEACEKAERDKKTAGEE